MDFILSILNTNIFMFLAMLHVFWAVGGEWGSEKAVPKDINGRRVINPSRFTTFLVGVGLLGFAFVNVCFIGVLELNVAIKYQRYMMYAISVIFFLRFIGDLKYVGIFKKYRQTAFASKDTVIYSPLSLFLAVSHAVLVAIVS